MFLSLKRVNILVTTIFYAITMFLGLLYLQTNDLSWLLYTVVMLFISNLLLSLNNLKYYLIHALFYLMIFTFLFSRPLIDYIRTGSFETYQADAYVFTFKVLIISLVALALGGILGKRFFERRSVTGTQNPIFQDRLNLQIRRMSLVIFWLSYPFYVLRLLERLLFRLQTSYYEYYANFNSRLPYFTYILSAFMFYALCVYLATRPSKWHSIFMLFLYTAANMIYLLIGTRNPFILSLIFSFVYFFMRHYTDTREVWLGKVEKIAMGVGTPVLMLAMGAMNYLRDGAAVKFNSVFALLVDFLYKQGTSFGVIARGYLYQSSLPIREVRNYTFGSIIDYVLRGSIGNQLLGTTPFVNSTNSLELALESNSYAHNISYIVMRQDYLDGHGIGSSYIMEVFTDYGMLGLFIVNLLLGILFIALLHAASSKNIFGFSISLLILGNIFFMPRSSFAESFFSLFTMQFWTIMIVIFLMGQLMKKPLSHTTYTKDGYLHV